MDKLFKESSLLLKKQRPLGMQLESLSKRMIVLVRLVKDLWP